MFTALLLSNHFWILRSYYFEEIGEEYFFLTHFPIWICHSSLKTTPADTIKNIFLRNLDFTRKWLQETVRSGDYNNI